MHPHDSTHDALLERLVVGELAPTSAEARARLESCEPCREKFDAFERLQSSLARAGEDERAGVAQSLSGELTPGMDQQLRRFAEAHVSPRRAPSRWLRVASLALAASVVGVIGYRMYHGASIGPRQETPLGEHPDVVTGDSPQGHVKGAWDEFTWRAPILLAGETFTLRITNLDLPELDPLVVGTIQQTSWKRSAARHVESRRVEEFFARDPRRIEWSVEIRRENHRVGRPAASLRASLD